MLEKGQEIELKIEDFAFEGKCVSRVEGFVVFVSDAVPGDTVLANVQKVKKNFAEAKAIHIIRESSLREIPKCKYFGVCGGCKWQHLKYQSQLEFKRRNVIDAFERIGGFKDVYVSPTLGSEDIYFYRNKMEFSFANQRWLTLEELQPKDQWQVSEEKGPALRVEPRTAQPRSDFALGLHVPNRFDKVLDIEECWLQSNLSNQILNAVREFGKAGHLSIYSTKTHTGYLRNLVIRETKNKEKSEIMVNLVTSEDRAEVMQNLTEMLVGRIPQITTVVNNITSRKSQVAVGDYESVYLDEGFITDRIGDFSFRISANSFFQTNTKQAEKLYAITRDLAELRHEDIVYDLYSGAGTIALYVSRYVNKVIGIELVESAISDARQNAELNGVNNCFFLQGDLKDRLTNDTGWVAEYGRPDVMIIDPPRSGMHPKMISALQQLLAMRIVYVSCNPATQARDLKDLCGEMYKIEFVQPIDMFPHTYHIENVVRLTLR
jgi:23S rRNA (uracil1939-C5)-methyltransferase